MKVSLDISSRTGNFQGCTALQLSSVCLIPTVLYRLTIPCKKGEVQQEGGQAAHWSSVGIQECLQLN